MNVSKLLKLRESQLLVLKPQVCLIVLKMIHQLKVTALVRRNLAEVENNLSHVEADRKALSERVQKAEKRVHDLQANLDVEGRDASELELLHQSLAAELKDKHEEYLKDISDRDFAADQTRKKYQGELAQLSEGNSIPPPKEHSQVLTRC